jgi:hypothetical protein
MDDDKFLEECRKRDDARLCGEVLAALKSIDREGLVKCIERGRLDCLKKCIRECERGRGREACGEACAAAATRALAEFLARGTLDTARKILRLPEGRGLALHEAVALALSAAAKPALGIGGDCLEREAVAHGYAIAAALLAHRTGQPELGLLAALALRMLRGCGEGLESLLDMIEMHFSPELVERIAAAAEEGALAVGRVVVRF